MLTERTVRELYLVRDIVLKRNGYKDYAEFLKSKYWKQVKEKTRSSKYRDNYNKCRVCKSRKNIQLHHENYRWLLTKDELRSIVPVCKKCHIRIHNLAYNSKMTFGQARELISKMFKVV